MGLFSRKSPEEKRMDKFNKKIKLAEKTTRSWNCPIGVLYMLSSNEDEYKKTSEYYKQWNSKYFAFKFEEKRG